MKNKYIFFGVGYKSICISHYPDDETAHPGAERIV